MRKFVSVFVLILTVVPMAMQAASARVTPMQLAPAQPAPVRRVNAPFFGDEAVGEHASAIFWFGQVTPTQNYTDVRVGYNNHELLIQTHIFDRRIWYSDQPAPNDSASLTQWDSVSVYLDTRAQPGDAPAVATYRITVQANWPDQEANFRSVERGAGVAGYTPITASVSTEAVWRGDGPNNDIDDRGWFATLHLPFASLGVPQTPIQGSLWRMALQVHDRDDNVGSAIEASSWPEAMQPQQPSTWAELHFGLPTYTAPAHTEPQVAIFRQGLNGAQVVDASVGGGTTCADNYDYFADFGNINRASEEHANVQNQSDVADWPCFSKFYLTFPLATLPAGRVVVSATLTAYQFGNSGQGVPPAPISSLIQAIAVNEDWQETHLTWNNAPLALENFSMTRALPMSPPPANQPVESVPVIWDVSQAVQNAYASQQPLRLALYSADEAQNSGKYFWTSDVEDGLAAVRPTLNVTVGVPIDPSTLAIRTYMPIVRRD